MFFIFSASIVCASYLGWIGLYPRLASSLERWPGGSITDKVHMSHSTDNLCKPHQSSLLLAFTFIPQEHLLLEIFQKYKSYFLFPLPQIFVVDTVVHAVYQLPHILYKTNVIYDA